MPDNTFTATEEFTLYCDVCGCDAQLSLVFGVSRSIHGWGRATVYDDDGVHDYDLCAEHYKQLNAVLKRT